MDAPVDVVARKRHRCTWCSEGIAAGETYKRWVSFDLDGVATSKMHPECLEAFDADVALGGDNTYVMYAQERGIK